MQKDPKKCFRVTNNAVEGYNRRIVIMFGAIKKPFSNWVKDICVEIEAQERRFEILAFGSELLKRPNAVNAIPEIRVEELLYGAEADELFNSVPKSNKNTLQQRL